MCHAVRWRFKGAIITVEPTVELAKIIMLDAGKIQEEDAEYKKRRHQKEGRKGRYPEKPLFTAEDAEKCMPLFKGVRYGETVDLISKVSARFHDAGHILGSASIEVRVQIGGVTRSILFSGDVGQWDKPLITDPALAPPADYIILESTYGDHLHPRAVWPMCCTDGLRHRPATGPFCHRPSAAIQISRSVS